MKKIIIIIFIFVAMISGCNSKEEKDNHKSGNITKTKVSEEKMNEVSVTINNKKYKLILENSKTVEEFLTLLPQSFDMKELNGNEKYVYLDKQLTANAYKPKQIEKGDVMLFGNNCLVIFYKSFATNYNYTKIGHIDNLDSLSNSDITIRFEK